MLRLLEKTAFLCLLAAATSGGAWLVYGHDSVERQLRRQRERTEQLQLIVQRLTAERRVADLMVTDQSESGGILHTTLLWVEYAKDGSSLPGKRFVIEGKMAHIDAMVIKFEGRFVQENDPLRGRSIALFTRLYGDHQSPAEGQVIDAPDRAPAIYHASDPKVAAFEQRIWSDFWKLADDTRYRQSMGVRVAQGEAVWRSFEPGWLYTLTLESNGGLNISPEPIKGIYQEALQSRAAN